MNTAIHACEDAWAAARRYLAKQTAHWESGRVTDVAGYEDVKACEMAIEEAMRGGDVEATKTACRAYWQAFLGHTF